MKKQVKKNLIAALSLAFVASFGVAGLVKSNVNAGAEAVVVEGNFTTLDGAAIRIKSDTPSGIRWSVSVTKAYYDYVTGLDANAKFGTIVDNKAIDAANDSEETTQEFIACSATPTFDSNGVWTYYASITYDELELTDTDKLTKVYETELQACGYVYYNNDYVLAEAGDTERSIKGVAMNCLIQENTTGNDDVTDTNKSTFETYAGGEYATIESETLTKNAYDTKNATGTIISQDKLTAGTYSVYVGAKKFDDVTLNENGAITATVTGLGSTLSTVGETNNVRFINADGEVYQVPFVSATHLISTKDQFQAYLSSYDNASPSSEQIAEEKTWYAVLTNDIVLTEEWKWQRTQKSWLRGTFDGLGHVVDGPVFGYGVYGLFGGVSSGATVKNVGFTNLYGINGSNGHDVLSGYMSGTMENVYVKGTTKDAPRYVRVYGTMKNCIFDVSFTGSTLGKTVWFNAGTNVFSIGAVDTTSEYPDKTTNYATTAAFLAEQGENACWNGYWSFNDFGLCFGDTLVAQYATETKATAYGAAYTYANNAYTKQDTFTVDVSSLIGNAENYTVLLDGEEVETDGVLTLNVANYTMGSTHEVTVAANGKVYSQPFMVVSHAISTKDQFQTYLASYDHASISDEQKAEEQTWYAVLTNDIVLTEEWKWQRTNKSYLRGTFDGLGHVVDGPVLGCGVYGLFGGVRGDATVKNVGFTNLYGIDASTTHHVLSGYMGGTMENVYVKGTSATTSQYVRIAYLSGTGDGTIKNCVFDVTYTGTAGTVTVDKTAARRPNTFTIGNTTDTLCTNYATAADFISAQLTNVNTTNGWNMDVWSVEEGKLYFGTALVG